MIDSITHIFDDCEGGILNKILWISFSLVAFNLGAWICAFYTFDGHPLQLGTALLAYTFGLRHAVDADHIAAIDNVTRKLMQEGKRPVAIGLFFSLGHSTIVVLASMAVAFTATAFRYHLDTLHGIGEILGTLVSASFLFAIAIVNVSILLDTLRKFGQLREIAPYDSDLSLTNGGMAVRLLRPIIRGVSRSWQMYPLGFLFGLGFDTATEISLLAISAASTAQGLSIWSMLVFPALFTAGMSLVDTADGLLMLGAYGWAFIKPHRKLYYNITITSMSALIALIVGGLEALNLIGDQFQLKGMFWDAVSNANDHFGIVGCVTIGIFLGAWAISFLIYRAYKYDRSRRQDHIKKALLAK